jgi:hypothetical protein
MLKKYPPFDPTQGFIAPGIIWEVRELSESLGLQADEVKSLFTDRAEITHKNLRLPIVPAEAWDRIRFELKAAPSDTTIRSRRGFIP